MPDTPPLSDALTETSESDHDRAGSRRPKLLAVSKRIRTRSSKSAPEIFRGLQPIGIIAIIILGVATVGPPWTEGRRSIPIYIIVTIGVAIGVFAPYLVSRKSYSAFFSSIFGWVPVSLGAATYPFWYLYAGGSQGEVGSDFFHAAADILPVILLATVIDVRRTRELSGKQLVPPIAAVFFGELAALNALAFDDSATGANFAVVCASLVTATFALVIAVMADLSPPAEDEGEANKPRIDKIARSEAAAANTGSSNSGSTA